MDQKKYYQPQHKQSEQSSCGALTIRLDKTRQLQRISLEEETAAHE
jgi:hypothetical protein